LNHVGIAIPDNGLMAMGQTLTFSMHRSCHGKEIDISKSK